MTSTTAPASAVAISQISPWEGPPAVSACEPMKLLRPVGVGSTTIGRTNNTAPPRARNPSNPTATSPG